MHTVEEKIVVPYTTEQMFDLIADVESYPRFLAWCADASILEASPLHQVASLHIAYGPIKQKFTTQNELDRPYGLNLELLDGPFSTLTGRWQFLELHDIVDDQPSCHVLFSLRYNFKNRWLEHLIGPVFSSISHSLVGAFTEEAKRRYDASIS